jgi:hypothetical protein
MNTSPWPARLRLVQASPSLVLASLSSPQAPRPCYLNWTAMNHQKREKMSSQLAVTVARNIWLAVPEINLGDTFTRSWIWFRPKKDAVPRVNRSVRGLAGALSRCSPSRISQCKEIEVRGHFCKMSATELIVFGLLRVIQKPWGLFRKTANAGAGVPRFSVWLGRLGWMQPSTVQSFHFSFSVQLWKSVKNCRKILKLWNQFS